LKCFATATDTPGGGNRIVGNAQIIELLEKLADLSVVLHHPVGVNAEDLCELELCAHHRHLDAQLPRLDQGQLRDRAATVTRLVLPRQVGGAADIEEPKFRRSARAWFLSASACQPSYRPLCIILFILS
jgi:hypothetical protein